MKAAVVIWAIACVLVTTYDYPLRVILWIGLIAVWVALAAAGPLLVAVGLVRARKLGWPRAAVALALTPLAVGVLLALVAGALRWAGDAAVFRVRFAHLKPKYERVISEVRAGKLPRAGTAWGVVYECADDPMRFAFPQPGGIIDNWEGVIFDPTGEVAKARGWAGRPGNFSAPPEIRRLFGGDLVSCRHVSGAFHRCWFT